MLIAIVLDRPLVEAQALVEAPDAFPSDHQDHARQTESPNYCANDQVEVNDDLKPSRSCEAWPSSA